MQLVIGLPGNGTQQVRVLVLECVFNRLLKFAADGTEADPVNTRGPLQKAVTAG